MGMQLKPFFHVISTQVPVTERKVDEQMDMTTSTVYKYTTCTNKVNNQALSTN
jgi:hypothetical protein